MKKIFSCLASITLMLTLIFAVGSCSKSGDMEDLLKTVPSDSYFVLSFNANELLDQLDYKQEGDHATYCKELRALVTASGLDRKDVKKMTDAIDLSNRTCVLFGYENKIYFTFSVNDPKGFRKWVEKALEEDVENEGDGFYSANNKLMIMKDNQVWFVSDYADPDDIQDFIDLDSKSSFAGKYAKTAAKMCAPENSLCAFLNIDESLSLARNFGLSSEITQIQLALGTIFKDAEALTVVSSLYSDRAESVLTVINAEEEPAEFLVPMGKINTSAMNKVNNNAMMVAALGVSPDLMKMVKGLTDKYMAGAPGEAAKIIDLILSMRGTSAISVNSEKEIIASVGFTDGQAAREAGTLLGSAMPGALASTAGNFLIFRSSDSAKAGGNAPEEFEGQFIALCFDYGSKSFKELSGLDLSDLGKVTAVMGPDGKGVCIKSVWMVKDPVKTLLKTYMDNAAALSNLGNVGSGYAVEEITVDTESVAVAEEIVEIEPDLYD